MSDLLRKIDASPLLRWHSPPPVLLAGILLAGFAGLVMFGGRTPKVLLEHVGRGPHDAVRVDAQIRPDAAIPLADGSALYPVGPAGAPQMWAWCAEPTQVERDVVGAVLGWVGAHTFSPALADGLANARRTSPDSPANPAVIAVQGCSPDAGDLTLRDEVQPADRPLPAGYPLDIQFVDFDRTHLTPLPDGRSLIPFTMTGPTTRAQAWALCKGPLDATRDPRTGGRVLGHVGAGNLPEPVQQALADAEASGWIASEPSAPVLDVGKCSG